MDDGWMGDGLMHGRWWIDGGWMDGWMMDGWVMDGWMVDGWMDGWMMDGWTDGWMGRWGTELPGWRQKVSEETVADTDGSCQRDEGGAPRE